MNIKESNRKIKEYLIKYAQKPYESIRSVSYNGDGTISIVYVYDANHAECPFVELKEPE